VTLWIAWAFLLLPVALALGYAVFVVLEDHGVAGLVALIVSLICAVLYASALAWAIEVVRGCLK
jgi:hypothetical protein